MLGWFDGPDPLAARRADMRIGLTGGIGSGKSTVAAMLPASDAVRAVDTDRIARELTLPGGAAMPAVQAAFGAGVVAGDGGLDRAAMRDLVFADAGREATRLEPSSTR